MVNNINKFVEYNCMKKKKKKKKKKKHSINENLIMIEYLAEIIILMKYLLLILK